VRQQADVAAMQVAMNEAVDEDHPVERAQSVSRGLGVRLSAGMFAASPKKCLEEFHRDDGGAA
jgi:hypothetical protein